MKVLLIDVDSKIPNLALMKLSAYHKCIGDNVGFNNTDNPDIVYASVVFKKNKHLVDGLKFYYPDSEIIIGGSGYDINKKLPDEIEIMKPDYDLYPECEYSIGYTTRGCDRNCGFCIVPKKEGKFQINQHPEKWYNPNFDKIVFLDNNILFNKDWFMEVTDFCIKNNLQTWFTQGLDIRLVDVDVVNRLKEIKKFKGLFFAFDSMSVKDNVLSGIELLKNAGINLRSDVNFYVYCEGYQDEQYEDAVNRCRILKEFGTNAFVMYNIDKKRTPRIKHLQRWANRRWCYWSCDILEYKWFS